MQIPKLKVLVEAGAVRTVEVACAPESAGWTVAITYASRRGERREGLERRDPGVGRGDPDRAGLDDLTVPFPALPPSGERPRLPVDGGDAVRWLTGAEVHPLVQPVGGNQAASSAKGWAVGRFLGPRLGAVRGSGFQRPSRDQAPAQGHPFPAAVRREANRPDRRAGCAVVAGRQAWCRRQGEPLGPPVAGGAGNETALPDFVSNRPSWSEPPA